MNAKTKMKNITKLSKHLLQTYTVFERLGRHETPLAKLPYSGDELSARVPKIPRLSNFNGA